MAGHGLSRRRLAAVAAARACVGTPFRPQGRVIGLGLDCIGVALMAARGARVQLGRLPAYALGGDHEGEAETALAALGCRRVRMARAGDVLVAEPQPGQRHIMVVTDRGVIQAHAGLGRVVEGPFDSMWRLLGAWRLPGVR